MLHAPPPKKKKKLLYTGVTKGTLNMSTEAFCVFKRAEVSIQTQCEHCLDRKLPQNHCDCLVGWSSNMTLLSLSFTHPLTSFLLH